MKKNSYLGENIIKNILVLIVAVLFFPMIANSAQLLPIEQIGNFLLLVSILLVAVCFANFAFTYEKCNVAAIGQRYLAHIATFIFMLLLALLLISLVIIIQILIPSIFQITLVVSILLYLGIALYDFWDLLRINEV